MKRICAMIMTLLLCLGLIACGQIADENGDQDTSLATLTREELVASNPTSVEAGSVKSSTDGRMTWKVKKFSGVKVLGSIEVQEGAQSLVISADSSLEKGNLYTFVCRDGEIIGAVATGTGAKLTIKNPKAGKYELRAAGESAAFELSVRMSIEP